MSVTITRTAWVDDDGSGTTGTIINNAVKTELYGQIDTALALLLPLAGGTISGALTVTAAVTVTAGPFTLSGLADGSNGLKLIGATTAGPAIDFRNATTGLLAQVYVNNAKTIGFYNTSLSMSISTAGVVTITNLATGSLTSVSGVITSSSDPRLKDRIVPLPYGLDEVMGLRPVLHGYNELSGLDRTGLHGGFLADDDPVTGTPGVKGVMPLAVSVGNDGYLSLSDRPILGAVVISVQNHEGRIKELEDELARLTGTIH